MTKAELRARLLARRRFLTPLEVERAAHRVRRHVLALPVWPALRRVLVYLPARNEVDTWGLIHALWARGAQTLAPCCRPDRPGEMDCLYFDTAQRLHPGAFNILEPDRQACAAADMTGMGQGDGVLVPGVGFDRQGFRLGFGGGYYDRLLADLAPEVVTIGLAYAFQVVDELPREEHDLPVDIICTDQGTLRVKA
jgi:5-formyltetrahydrofolate cyclo-ligase